MTPRRKIINPHLIGSLMLVICFLTYPMALIIPSRAGVDFRYDVTLPTLFIATILCLISFLSGNVREAVGVWIKRHSRVVACGCISLTGLIVTWWLAGSTLPQMITFLSLFVIPVYCLISPHPFSRRHFGGAMGILWLAQAGHGLQQVIVHWQVLGLTGNRNWTAAIIAATAPWAWRMACQLRHKDKIWRFLCGGLVGGISLFLMYQAGSRAAWLILATYLLFKCVALQPCAWRRTFTIGLAAVIVLTVFGIKKEAIIHRLADDVRGPIWLSTARMIADHPLAGVSPGAFRGAFVAYRTDWQMQTSKAAATTNHPHNECLRIAAVGGIPAALVWSLAGITLLIFKPRDTHHAAIHYSAFILVGCGMFDLTLFMPPTALPALLFLGLYLRLLFPREDQAPHASVPLRIPRIILALVICFFAGHHVWNRLRFGWHVRQSHMALEKREFATARDQVVKAYLLFPNEAMPLYQAVKITLADLHDPVTATRLGKLLVKVEPDIAHINWMLGVAYDQLGKPETARPYFRRESDLYPFTVRVQSDALNQFMRVKDFKTARVIRDRLAQARFQHLTNQVGRAETETMISDFLRAVSTNDRDQAVKAANRILEKMPFQGWRGPAAGLLPKTRTFPVLDEKGGFIGTEMNFWKKMTLPSPFPLSLSPALVTQFADFTRGNGNSTALDLARRFHLGGWQTAVVTSSDKNWPRMVDIRQGNMKALVLLFPGTEKPPRLIPGVGVDDLFRSPKRTVTSLPPGSPSKAILTLPLQVPDFLTRNQILGDILRRGKARGAPPIGTSPGLAILSYQAVMNHAAGKDQFAIVPSIQE